MKTKFNGILTLLLALVVQLTFAQEKTVSGVVSDETGPLPGVSVLKKGTMQGTETDFDGKYSIKVKTGDVLVFSFVGMKTTEKVVGSSNNVNVKMDNDNVLEEVVVTGVAAGTSTKKLGFSVGKVDIEGTKETPTINAASAIQGKIAGAQIINGTGNPLRESSIQLRGATSILGNTSPLIIVDGIITEGGLSEINSEDIASIEVVKGAAASSLYGSLAGNGVIQIITKKGKTNKPQFTFKTELGFSGLQKKYPLATKTNYQVDSSGNFILDAKNNVQSGPKFINNYPSKLVDNVSAMIQNQAYTSYNASLSQRVGNSNYFLSLRQLNQDALIKGLSPFKRQNYRFNYDVKLNDKLKARVRTSYAITKGQEVEQAGQGDNFFYSAMTIEPVVDITRKNENGDYVSNPYSIYTKETGVSFEGSNASNPLYVTSKRRDDIETDRFIGGIGFEYQILDNLSLSINQSFDKKNYQLTTLYPKGYQTPTPSPKYNDGYLRIRDWNRSKAVSEAQLQYRKQFTDLSMTATLKYLFENSKYHRNMAWGSKFAASGVQTLENTTDQKNSNSYNRGEKAQNIFFNLDLDYKDKVIFSGLIRRDGTSLFGTNNRWKWFYRTSLAYRISEDLKEDWIDELKIRASYGVSGLRPKFGWKDEIAEISSSGSITLEQLGNADLTSPEIGELELGIDFDFLNKYKFQFTYANSRTKDDFLNMPLTGAIAGKKKYINGAETEYQAYEASFNAKLVDTKDFSWNAGLIWGKINNKYVSIASAPYTRTFDDGLFDAAPSRPLFRVEAGVPYGAMFGLKFMTSLNQVSVNESGNVLNSANGTSELKKEDLKINSDGYVIVAANENTDKETPLKLYDTTTGTDAVTLIGDTTPDFNLGFTNNFNYKDFSLYFLVDWQKGGDIYNFTRQNLYYNNRHADLQEYGAQGKHNSYATSGVYDKANVISHFVEDGSYVKLREIALSYTLNKDIFKSYIDDVKFTLSARNLYTWTDYSGWDPEVTYDGNTTFKVDDYAYPNFRTWSASVQIRF